MTNGTHFRIMPFSKATNRRAGTAIVHLGEHCSFRGATNKSAVTAPLNEHMKIAFRKWQFSHPKCEHNWPKKLLCDKTTYHI